MLDYLKRHHLAIFALFVALGGTSYAATELPPNSVGTSQLRGAAVTSAKIQSGAITSAKLSRALNAMLKSSQGAANKRRPAGAATALAYGYYDQSQPCIPAANVACPAILTVGRLRGAVNVSLANRSIAAQAGTVCLIAGPGFALSSAVVVTSLAGGPSVSAAVAEDHAEWIPNAPNCSAGQFEVDTYYVTVDGSGQHVTRVGLPFAFVIL